MTLMANGIKVNLLSLGRLLADDKHLRRQSRIETAQLKSQVLPLKWLANANITNIVQLFRQTTYSQV
jgi:hypothetical protein